MVDKLHDYQGPIGRLHSLRDSAKLRWEGWKEQRPKNFKEAVDGLFEATSSGDSEHHNNYSHIYRRKTQRELIRISAAVMGIEFSYAAETAFVSPTLLEIGVDHAHMSLVWALSPLVGFFLTPVLGSLSDRCRLKFGRRRPFIIILAFGVLLGLLLIPNGANIGHALGDFYPSWDLPANATLTPTTPSRSDADYPHPWSIVFTILGTVLLDFDADACQSPARAYLLDVCMPDDHARGLSMFTIMAGLGGFFGYAMGGMNWDATAIGEALGGHVKAVFTLITFIFVTCVAYTISSFKEVPLDIVESDALTNAVMGRTGGELSENQPIHAMPQEKSMYGTLPPSPQNKQKREQETQSAVHQEEVDRNDRNGYVNSSFKEERQNGMEAMGTAEVISPSLKQYLMSIVLMPWSMRVLCLTNLFCWMAHVCYSLYFTDFVGEAVFNGDPKGTEGSEGLLLYEQGVRFGCWGMSMYSLSCACYSMIIEKLITKYKAKPVYVGGLLFYSTGMCLLALTKHPVSVILFSWTAGVMYSTLFTMPYLLIAHYHASNTFSVSAAGISEPCTQLRGLGTDVAIVSSMVFLAQFLLSCAMGTIVNLAGTTTVVVAVASFLAFCGALTATQVMYLDL